MILFFTESVFQIGDIPDAEIKPPDNVLFVCKLNPVTEVSHAPPIVELAVYLAIIQQ